jgi:hypothetical protein
MRSAVSTIKAFGPDWRRRNHTRARYRIGSEHGQAHRRAFRSLAIDRLAYRGQQFTARERLRQDVAHPKLARHRDRGARTPSESHGEKQNPEVATDAPTRMIRITLSSDPRCCRATARTFSARGEPSSKRMRSVLLNSCVLGFFEASFRVAMKIG